MDNDEGLGSGIKLSFIIHTLLISMFTLREILFPSQTVEIMESVRVDLIDLPDKHSTISRSIPHSVPQIEKKPENSTKPETDLETQQKSNLALPMESKKILKPLPTKDSDTINLNQVKKKQQDAIKKLKRTSAIEKIKQDLENESKESSNKPFKQNPIKGTVLSKGNSLTGLDRIKFDDYVDSLDQKIKDHFYLTRWLSGKKLKAVLVVKIDKQGQVLERLIVHSSGNSSYDDLALEAIDKSNPFPEPPDRFVEHLAEVGFKIEFADSNNP